MPHDDTTLLDITHAARLALDFVSGLNRESFENDTKTQSAILHQLLVVGEAVKRLSTEFRSTHSTIPWSLIAGMRDKIIHAYYEVDLDQVWVTLQRDIPDLLKRLEPLLPEGNEP